MMNVKTLDEDTIKRELTEFYTRQSGEKTQHLEAWLESGSPRIPQSKTYYYFEDRKIAAALNLARLKPRSHVIEVGCNLGQMTFPLAQMGFSVTGIDLAADAVQKATMRARHYAVDNIRFITHDAQQLDELGLEPCDAFFSFSALRYMPHPDAVLRQMYHLLKPNGCAVVDFPNRYCPWYNWLKPFVFVKKHMHDHYFSAPEAISMMRTAGFEDIECELLLFSHKSLPPVMLPLLRISDMILEHTPLINRLAAIIMVKGRK